MKKPYSALETAILPQYEISATLMDRFLIAAHFPCMPINRYPNYPGKKDIEHKELHSDHMNYFIENQDKFRANFSNELRDKIHKNEFDTFCKTVADDWVDGISARHKGGPRRLKRSVFDYLCKIASASDNFIQSNDLPTDVEPLISVYAVAAILTVNDQMIQHCLEEWICRHANCLELSIGDVFLRRGLYLREPIDTSLPYREYDFINSYSLALSISEQFSQLQDGKSTIVNGELAIFLGRTLFFSPFIPQMDARQLEFGVIPSEKPLPLHFQGEHAGILEYILDPHPFQREYLTPLS